MKRSKGDADFGAALRFLRTAREWSLVELGQRADCSKQHVWDIETARKAPSFQLACALADALGVSADALRDLKRAKAAAKLLGIG